MGKSRTCDTPWFEIQTPPLTNRDDSPQLLSRWLISLIELGKTNPSLRSIFDICGSLQMKPSAFLSEVEKLASFELPL
jgi:transcriptional regulator with XRE-family HTH domain